MNTAKILEAQLNAATKKERLAALEELMALYKEGTLKQPENTNYVNNHIHTTYSFSPYSPTSAAYTAWKNGLVTAGIVDHDSVAGIKEFLKAGEIIGIAVTSGFEVRCSMDETPFRGKRINNPDQKSVAYVACHGIPHQNIDKAEQWLAPYRANREKRNRSMVKRINALLPDSQLHIDYDQDVRSISQVEEGGSVTERHILYALSHKMTSALGKGQPILNYLQEQLSIEVTGGNLEKLSNPDTPYYEYYLLGVLKSSMVEQFYIDAMDECPTVQEFVRFTKEIGALSAYAYLGDIEDSVTGDKAAQSFEDSYLDQLIPWLAKIGFDSVTYMPTRNTSQQLARLTGLLDDNGLFQISGEDINTPFQSFICEALDKPQFQHLVTSTWALIGHEKAASKQQEDGLFTEKTVKAEPDLQKRIQAFAALGKE